MELSEETKHRILTAVLQDSLAQKGNGHIFFSPGKSYFFRGVTFHLIGTIETMDSTGAKLRAGTVSYIGSSGRFQQAINTGTLNEVEPVKVSAYVNFGALVDAFEWGHDLPRVQV